MMRGQWRWYLKAAENKDMLMLCEFNLGMMDAAGGSGNLEKDEGKAVEWYKKAALNRDMLSFQNNLGAMYDRW